MRTPSTAEQSSGTITAPTLVEVLAAHPGTPLPGETAAQVLADVEEAAAALRRDSASADTPILSLPNGRDWVVRYLASMLLGRSPVLVSPDTPGAELARLRHLAAATDPLPGSARIPTSGSTGAATLVARDQHSLVAEGHRYRDGVDLVESDNVLLPVPLAHSYALGFLYGVWLSGATAHLMPPTALNQIAAELDGRGRSSGGATVIALVPSLARLLAARARRHGPGRQRAPRLRLAMAGAGPVDANLQTAFQNSFGLGLARNYGSTELGATISGPADLPPLAAGSPLPGVCYRLLDPRTEDPVADGPGRLMLQVSADAEGRPCAPTSSTPWHDTGDIAVVEPNGVLRIVGRQGRAIRRGDRWVSPLEIEAVLRAQPGVRNAVVHARDGAHAGEESIVAEVILAPDGPTADQLRAVAKTQLATHKIPDRIIVRRRVTQSAAGKLTARPRYRLSREALDVARAYKAAELVFALHDLGALEALAAGADADELAHALGCDVEAIDWLLYIAHGLGVLGPDDGDGPRAAEVGAYIRLEALLSRSLVTREELAAVARGGVSGRHFEDLATGAAGPHAAGSSRSSLDLDVLRAVYGEAMHGQHARGRTGIGLRMLCPRPGDHLVEITAGPGRYLDALLASDPAATGHLVRIGHLAEAPSERVTRAIDAGSVVVSQRPPAGVADLCVIANAVHGPHPGDDLLAAVDSLQPGGRLLVDDVFLPDTGEGTGMELGLDWLTHGGIAWPSTAQLRAEIAEQGLDVLRDLRLGNSPNHLILISNPGIDS